MMHFTRYLATRLRRLASPAPATQTYALCALDARQERNGWERLDAFITGPVGAPRAVRERELVQENARAAITLIGQDGTRLVRRVTALHEEGTPRASEPALLVLALAHAHGDARTREEALRALARVARAGAALTPPGIASQPGRSHSRGRAPKGKP